MTINELLQWIAVIIILIVTAIYIVRRIIRKNSRPDCDDTESGCPDCPIADACRKSKKK